MKKHKDLIKAISVILFFILILTLIGYIWTGSEILFKAAQTEFIVLISLVCTEASIKRK